MAPDFQLDVGDYARGYDNLPDGIDNGRFTDDPNWRKFWVVKLEFKTDPSTNDVSFGTGFFLNLPDAANDIILTAGHNLITSSGQRTSGMIVHIVEPLNISEGDQPCSYQVLPQPVEESSILICPDYVKNPKSSENKINDWGVIKLPLPKANRPGFGFNLAYGFQQFGKIKVYQEERDRVIDDYNYAPTMRITAYVAEGTPGIPLERSGQMVVEGNERLRKDQLEYDITTEEGMSGSPVWVAYRGTECVVAIHNHGIRGRGYGSRGTRLNEPVFRQIFTWAGVGHHSKAIKATHDKAPAAGVYLQFHEDEAEIYLSVGAGSQLTKFDVLPAAATPTHRVKPTSQLYALYVAPPLKPQSGRWVIWNRKGETAELNETLHERGLVDIRDSPADGSGFKFVFAKGKKLEELVVDTSMISEDDIKRGEAELQGFILFKPFFKKLQSKVPMTYNKFILQ